jgi:hypothetical protein
VQQPRADPEYGCDFNFDESQYWRAEQMLV